MTILVLLWKEIVDNLRDRQTVFYALLFGPVLLPLLFGGALVAGIKQSTVSFDEPSTLAVEFSERAPNLMEFLHSNNIDIEPAPDNIQNSVRDGDVPIENWHTFTSIRTNLKRTTNATPGH